ncbi:hypothetical protein [Umezawaea tangerina]|uniref:Uncharacterized protein n=1 Tax=Umezawaea tangerina TaxID=84725 RepID=A0A2T0SC97_9PSEU|nr:hypothetical protein [Umezawaea tangerina]PRY31032.1 hypothetical protein CLV43_123134 [Umezawaea tangerina]
MTEIVFHPAGSVPGPEERLAELGLRVGYLDEAIWAGVNARMSAPPLGPTNGPGLLDWIHRVGRLREVLVGQGWSRYDKWNAGLVRHPSKPVVLGALQGNRHTGDEAAKLRSDYTKGPAITAMTQDNDHDQFSLFADFERNGGLKLWFLVTFPTVRDGRLVVLREVSQPEPTPQGQVIDHWAHRIVLPPYDFGPMVGGEEDGAVEVDFPVTLR